ncbi:hypothetical protein PHYSODRAFT_564932 [Phytophthora sojae]|uniref:E3 UFM1-protein ligase 1 homolog n=1 Tax=Phytophthora sojae (strain P6497) TaxID=1094619 RepID=G5A7B4_PHYSP|nr:hypothetical protein PHYSODRAFT_564932 [Phytophthora sojae]EGZ09219.1 hypothetical protein PHYSODRAFT_564932 [Phytophthora sojae]|eukprot:XP_009535852.1 hypothetical protein PHYSODRAFT_564932 [Phytophthora sojae]
MDEIALLQQQLAAVQQQEAALKLSDHNVIDLLLKLQQLGKLQVVHTRTGKQFLTPLQIQREVVDYVALHGGRLSLTELEKLIDVDRSHVERQAHALCRGRGGYALVNDGEELLTSWYLDGIMEDTDVLLQESGTTSVGDLAQQFGFAVDFMRGVVRARLGSILKARERDNVLYTDSYVAAQKARVRGVFAAVTRPIFMPDVIRSFGFDEAVATEALGELMQAKVLMGTLRGREYVPYVFMAAQRESMYSFFQQNWYLEHARAKELQVARPYDFLKKRFPDAVPLQESVVSRALQLQLEGAVEAAVNDNTFVDVRLLLPSALPAGDVGLLLAMSPALEKSGHVSKAYQIAESYAVSSGFFALCMEKFAEDATTRASRATAQQKSSGHAPSTRETRLEVDEADESDDEDFGGKRGKKGKHSKGGNKRDQEESSGKGGKSGKGKKGKRASKRGADLGGDDESRSAPSQLSIVPSREETIELLVKWFPVVEDLEGDDEFMDGMVAYLKPKLDEVYSTALTKALSSILRGDAASLRELRKMFEDRFDELLAKLLVLEKGFNKLSMHVDAKDASGMEQLALVETHVLESSSVELAALVTSFVAESNSLELEGVPLLDENKKVLESSLPQSTASALVRLWTLATAGRRSLSDFMAHVPVLAEVLSMPLRKLDRKKERQVIFGYRQATLSELDEKAAQPIEHSEEYAEIAALVLQLFFQQITALPGSFPRNTVSYGDMVLKAFRDEVSEDQTNSWSENLEATHALVLLKDLNSIE